MCCPSPSLCLQGKKKGFWTLLFSFPRIPPIAIYRGHVPTLKILTHLLCSPLPDQTHRRVLAAAVETGKTVLPCNSFFLKGGIIKKESVFSFSCPLFCRCTQNVRTERSRGKSPFSGLFVKFIVYSTKLKELETWGKKINNTEVRIFSESFLCAYTRNLGVSCIFGLVIFAGSD